MSTTKEVAKFVLDLDFESLDSDVINAGKKAFINFLAVNCITKLDDFEKFDYDNYSWDGENFIK